MVSCGPVTIRAITPSMATEPRNEERVCKAAKRLIEERDGGPLVDTECPDKTEHRKQAVELLFESPTKRYAIEHTRIESFPQQIADGKAFSCLLEPLETDLAGELPGIYTLVVAVGATNGIPVSDHERIRTLVKQWILANASKAAEGGGNQGSVSEQPPGVPFPLTLHGRVGSASRLLVARCTPDELETQRLQRVQTALNRKIPKLVAHKADGRETVLVLESCDTGLGNFSDIGVAVSKALAAFSNQPDSIILVETETTPWYVWPLKDGATVHTSQDCIEIDPDELE